VWAFTSKSPLFVSIQACSTHRSRLALLNAFSIATRADVLLSGQMRDDERVSDHRLQSFARHVPIYASRRRAIQAKGIKMS
jgi:hypothetical protein